MSEPEPTRSVPLTPDAADPARDPSDEPDPRWMVWVPWFLLASVVISCAGLGWYVRDSGRNQGTSNVNLYAQEREFFVQWFGIVDDPQTALLPERIPGNATDIQFSTVRGPMFPDWSLSLSYVLPEASAEHELERIGSWYDFPAEGGDIEEHLSNGRFIRVRFEPENRRFSYEVFDQ